MEQQQGSRQSAEEIETINFVLDVITADLIPAADTEEVPPELLQALKQRFN